MTSDLKTLNDFKEHYLSYSSRIKFGDTFLFKGLKQEAIKWAKKNGWTGNNHDSATLCLTDWLDFFNITEEDLK